MLHEIFYWILNMSITAVITGVFVLLIRLIKKIPRRFVVFLWIVPFLRMCIPFGLNSRYSLMTLFSQIFTKTIIIYRPTNDITFSLMNSVRAADTYFPLTYKINTLEDVFKVTCVIWLIVSLFILLMLIFTYFLTINEIKDSKHFKDNIYLSEKIVSPAVYGIIKPKIILPESYKDKDIEYVILHEKAHIRYLDNLWRVVAFIITSVHWFNPFCWLFLKEFLKDIELSCDERVLAKSSENKAKEYAKSLLECKQETTMFVSAFAGAKIRTRIENILSFKKLTWFSIISFVLLIGVVFYVLLTNAG